MVAMNDIAVQFRRFLTAVQESRLKLQSINVDEVDRSDWITCSRRRDAAE